MIRAMNLRDEQRDTTRRRIVDAVARLLADAHPAALSVPQVASTAGVSVRTVYRYFPNKEQLVRSVADLDDPVRTVGVPRADGRDLPAYLRRAWSDEVQRPRLRAQLRTADGQRVRSARRASQRAFAERAVEVWDIDLDAGSRRRLVDVLLLLTGAAALVELTDVLGETTDEAAASAAWAAEAVLVHARRTGRVPGADDAYELDPSR